MVVLTAGVPAILAGILAVLLVTAGTIKIIQPRYAAGSLRRVIGAGRAGSTSEPGPAAILEWTARSLGLAEVGTGAALLLAPQAAAPAVALAAAVMFAGFVLVTRLAQQRGASCGCWGSLSDGPAGNGELRRRALLAVAAAALVALRVWPPSTWYSAAGRRVPDLFAIPEWAVLAAAVGTLVLAVGAGTWLAVDDRRPAVYRLLGAAGMGVRSQLTATARGVSGRTRRRVIDGLRDDPTVRAVIARFGAHERLSWRHARVTVPRARDAAAVMLVSVPGEGANLRIMVFDDQTPSVVGETERHILLGRSGGVVAAPKRSATG